MEKDFDKWNPIKKRLHTRTSLSTAHPREIWWCSLGLNIGAETDGKHNSFERPVLVMKVYSRESLLILPITSKSKNDKFHFPVVISDRNIWIKLTQSRVISNRRLLRKIGVLQKDIFLLVKEAFKQML